MALDPLAALLAGSGIVIIGFIGTLVFEKTKIPDILILIFLGLLLGPINNAFIHFAPLEELTNRDRLEFVTPLFAALALMIILFDGGLNLSFRRVLRRFGVSTLHTLLNFLGAVIAVTAVGIWVFGLPPAVAVLLGSTLGGPSGAIVVGLVRQLRISESTKVVLTLESVLTDVLCVVSVLALVEFIRLGPLNGLTPAFGRLASGFLVAVFTGFGVGIFWLVLLRFLTGKQYGFMLTIAILMVLYAVTEYLGGSGAVASLIFGLILGNYEDFSSKLKLRSQFLADKQFKQFHNEISFVVRTFFFVFIGVTFALDVSSSVPVYSALPLLSETDGTMWLVVAGTIMMFAGIAGVRALVSHGTSTVIAATGRERRVLYAMMARGLAAAVLVSLPFTVADFKDTSSGYYQTLAPYKGLFLNVAFLIIALTVIATTIGVARAERLRGTPLRIAAPIQSADE